MNLAKVDLNNYRSFSRKKDVSELFHEISKYDEYFHIELHSYIHANNILIDLESKRVIGYHTNSDFIIEDLFDDLEVDIIEPDSKSMGEFIKRCYDENGELIWESVKGRGRVKRYKISWYSIVEYGSRQFKLNELLRL